MAGKVLMDQETIIKEIAKIHFQKTVFELVCASDLVKICENQILELMKGLNSDN